MDGNSVNVPVHQTPLDDACPPKRSLLHRARVATVVSAVPGRRTRETAWVEARGVEPSVASTGPMRVLRFGRGARCLRLKLGEGMLDVRSYAGACT